MSKTPKTLNPVKNIDELFQQIRDEITKENGEIIFRGEAENNDFICSSLAQEYKDEIQTEHFSLEKIQEQELEKIKPYTDLPYTDPGFQNYLTDKNEMTNLKYQNDILAEVRHYGGRAVLIDFTYDYNVALFFACDSKPEEDGRIILINTSKLPQDIKTFLPEKRLSIRVTSQKSILIRAPKRNHLYENEGEEFITIIPISKKLKQEIKIRLDKHHWIKTETIYRDIFGYIQHQGIHKDAETLFYKAYVLYEKREYDESIKIYNKVIELNPNYAEAYNNRGTAYNKKGEYDRAIDDYNKTIELKPNIPEAYNNRGNTYNNKGEYNHAAIADFNKAIELNPNYANAYNNRGRAKKATSDYKGAKEDFQTALQLAEQQGNKQLITNIQTRIAALTAVSGL